MASRKLIGSILRSSAGRPFTRSPLYTPLPHPHNTPSLPNNYLHHAVRYATAAASPPSSVSDTIGRIIDTKTDHSFVGQATDQQIPAISQQGVLNGDGRLLSSIAPYFHMHESFREIMNDYVHHEMSREWIFIGARLFLIVLSKDVFVSLAF